MDIELLATRTCNCGNIEQELRDRGLTYECCCAENIRNSWSDSGFVIVRF